MNSELPIREGSRARAVALTSAFSVLYVVLRLVPTFPMIGVAGTFSASDIIAPLYGIILGPYVGGASVALGTLLAIAFGRPTIFLGLDFVPATVNAVALGLLIKKRWIPVVVLFTLLLLLFLIHPLSLLLVEIPILGAEIRIPYNWLHTVGLALLLSPISRGAVKWVTAAPLIHRARGLFILSFIGTLMQHLAGSILFETILGLYLKAIREEAWPGIWTGIFLVYPLERTVLAVLAALVGVPLLRVLKAWGASKDSGRGG